MPSLHPYDEAAERSLQKISDVGLRRATARIFELAQRLVDAGEVDLVVIAARRLSCLYQLLLKAGMPQLTGCLAISNRVLDADPHIDWATTRVLVLDDSVVVGTTLYRLCGDLKARGASHVICRSICVDSGQRADYLLEDLDFDATFTLESDAVSRYSKEVVVALFENQVPFFTDYPTTVPLTLGSRTWATSTGMLPM